MVTKQSHEISDTTAEWADSRWTRPINGGSYEWIDATPAQGKRALLQADKRWLVPNIGLGQWEPYRPLVDTPALFRTFVDVAATEEGFRGFANQYGALLNRELATVGPVTTSKGPLSRLVSGVPLSRLKAEHEALGQVVGMLDALKRRSGLRVQAESLVRDFADRQRTLAGGFGPVVAALKTQHFDELKQACMNWVVWATNWHLSLQPGVGDVVLTVLGRDESGRLRVQQRTRSLLGALWLQCARAAQGEQRFKRCRACNGWFLISPDGSGKRRQAIYCSPRCKTRAWRAGTTDKARKGRRRSGSNV